MKGLFFRFNTTSSEAARAAQEAAARINRQLGLQSADSAMQPNKPPGPMGGGMMGGAVTEDHRVPDKMVGLSKQYNKNPFFLPFRK